MQGEPWTGQLLPAVPESSSQAGGKLLHVQLPAGCSAVQTRVFCTPLYAVSVPQLHVLPLPLNVP